MLGFGEITIEQIESTWIETVYWAVELLKELVTPVLLDELHPEPITAATWYSVEPVGGLKSVYVLLAIFTESKTKNVVAEAAFLKIL